MDRSRTRRGFTLIELAALACVLGTVGLCSMTSVHATRAEAMAQASADNLRQIGVGAGQYANDNHGRIFSYTWRGRHFL